MSSLRLRRIQPLSFSILTSGVNLATGVAARCLTGVLFHLESLELQYEGIVAVILLGRNNWSLALKHFALHRMST